MDVPRLDTLREVETPEGVDLNLSVAGPFSRAVAWGIDLGIRALVMFVLALGAVTMKETGFGLLLIAYFLLEWAYPVCFEVLWRGQTPGKRALGLEVVRLDGTSVDWGSSLLRNLIRVVDVLPCISLPVMFFTRHFQRLGDLAAGTMVVYSDRKSGAVSPIALAVGSAVPPSTLLTLDEQKALVAFAARAPQLGPARATELAGLVAPLIGSVAHEGQTPTGTVLSVAAWVSGRRGRPV